MNSPSQRVAVIGISGRFPGAETLAEFWENLSAGRSSIVEVPSDRWDAAAWFDPDLEVAGKSNSKWGGFLGRIDQFDPLFFGISPREAALMDPQQRLFLEDAFNAFENAGYSAESLGGTDCGVFVGAGPGDYLDLIEKKAGFADGYLLTGNTVSTYAGRVAYFLNLKGACMALDTACSSSLVAIHLACESIRSGRAEMAVAGGVSVMTTPKGFLIAGKTGLFAPDGCCRAFDESAVGYVPGEASVAVVLKDLDRAIRDGDHIHAIIAASGINHDGRTNGLTAPNQQAQSALQTEVLHKAGIHPDSISLVEAMATGTHLGDAIEVNALTASFRKHTDRRRYCAIGSLKTNIGHSGQPSAGAGLIKIILAMANETIPPTLHHVSDNVLANFSESPFFVADQSIEWKRTEGLPRRALLNAFGHSGTNACALIEEPPVRAAFAPSFSPYLLTVSGKTDEALRARAQGLLDWLKRFGPDVPLADLAFTLNAGRTLFRHRAALVVEDLGQLTRELAGVVSGQKTEFGIQGISPINAPTNPRADSMVQSLADLLGRGKDIDAMSRRKAMTALAQAFVRGFAIDWKRAEGGRASRRIPLPGYPFARERHWVREPSGGVASAAPVQKEEVPSASFFAPVWTAIERPDGTDASSSGAILVFDVGNALTNELGRMGRRVILVEPGLRFEETAKDRFTIRRTEAQDYSELLDRLKGLGEFLCGGIHAWSRYSAAHKEADLVSEGTDELWSMAFDSVFLFTQALVKTGGRRPFPFLFAFSGTGSGFPAQEAVEGLARCLPHEMPWLSCKVVSFESGTGATEWATAAISELDDFGPEEVSYRAGRRYVRRFEARALRCWSPGTTGDRLPARGGTYIISGGAGALGLLFAARLNQAFQANVVLLGRSPLSEERRRSLGALSSLGTQIAYLQVDVTDREQTEKAVAACRARFGSLSGVIHAAGVVGDGLISSKDLSSARKVLDPKVKGAMNLDAATRDDPLAFFALFSSISSVSGNVGQVEYATANRFLDAFGETREHWRTLGHRRGKTIVLNWPLWKEGGMRPPEESVALIREVLGLSDLESETGWRAFLTALDSHETQLVIIQGKPEGVLPLLNPPIRRRPAYNAISAENGPEPDLVAHISKSLVGRLSELLELDAARLPADCPITELGVDSMVFTQLILRLNRSLGLQLTPALLFEHPTIHSFAVFLAHNHAEKFESPVAVAHPIADLRSAPQLPSGENEARYPLSSGQQALWFLAQLAPENYAYNLPIVLPLASPVDKTALQSALNGLASRHCVLRTVFVSEAGRPYQHVQRNFQLVLREVSMGDSPKKDVLASLSASNRLPFALDKSPAWRATLFTRREGPSLLLVTIHHLIFDGASAPVFVEELCALHAAARTGDAFSLPPLGRRYDEFVAWQEKLLAGDEGRRLWDYWSREMAGVLPVLDLPTDRVRPAVQSYRGDTVKFEIDEACARDLRELARREEATLYMVLLGAFFVLVQRYCGQDDLIIGSPMMGRNESGFKRTIGYFINVVAIRGDLSGDPIFRSFLHELRGKVYGALEHQDFPMPLLVQRLKLPRDPSRSPLFQLAFNLETWARRSDSERKGSAATEILSFEPFEWLHQEGEFDLALDVFDLDRPLKSAFRFNPDLFDRATVEKMADHFQRLVREIASEPGRPISSYPLLGASEREQVLVHWNNSYRTFPRDACLHELIADQASRSPARIAVVCGKVSLTYAELNARAERWARILARAGIGRGARVGVCLDRTEAMIVSVFSVMKTGATYIPLDPAFPAERLEFMAADAELRWIITQESRVAWPAFQGRICLCVDSPNGELFSPSENGIGAGDQAEGVGADMGPSGPESAVYIIYTSGSTGRPKGVEISHRSLVNFLWSMADEPGLSKNDVLLAVTTLSFDIAALELYLPLVTGAQLVIASHEDAVDGRRLLSLLKTSGASVMQATPATWMMLIESGWREPLPLKVLCGGEALGRGLADRLLAYGREVWNLFGPTETTVWSTLARVTEGTEAVPIGRAIANTQVYVLDAHMQPVPTGVSGELYIGGEGVARGYWRRPELTAEKFVISPFGRSDADRLYRTGDIARWRKNGTIDFIGRADNQVKIRGFRIELGEVENALEKHPSIAQAAVSAREDRPGDRQLVAYWVRKGAAEPSVTELRAFLQSSLPGYMIPSVFVLMERFPLTPNGKLDRKQLPAPQRRRAAEDFEAPRSGIEKTLSEIWADAIGLERVGVRDNFFEIGGHSLLAAEVVRRTRLVHEIELLDLFTYPTIQALAAFIESRAATDGATGRPSPLVPSSQTAQDLVSPRLGIAIVGVSGRFPGAGDVSTFWENLRNGVESIGLLSDEELKAAGIDPEVIAKPNYVKAAGILEGADLFDADFFGYSHTHARMMDPQQRILLEAAWEALDDAGCDPDALCRRVGVFAGIGANTYYQPDIRKISETISAAAASLAFTSNEKDFAATRISYKLNLTGPSFTVQTACSSSLVAIHLACQSLNNGECEAALAGGVSVSFPQVSGYLHQKDMALSPDGHCRAFDADAQGTVFTNGVALVVLKPLTRALADRDQIYAVIRGTAIGNDGSAKVDYMAPSVHGQSNVIARALAEAGIGAQTIGLVEAHGTGTSVGDPIEVRAFADVFHKAGAAVACCALGSLKTNVGHLNTASGAASLIKAALCLKEKVFVPSLHFRRPNPHIDLAAGPFYVSTRLADWKTTDNPRRALVSSLGIGGTNAYAVMEEGPNVERVPSVRAWRLLPLSAKTHSALCSSISRLSAHLERTDVLLGDVAYTLQSGRSQMEWRHFIVSDDRGDAARKLGDQGLHGAAAPDESAAPRVAFLFAGEGAPGRGGDLYRNEPVFRRAIDEGLELLSEELGTDLQKILFPLEAERSDAKRCWEDPGVALPLTVLFEQAMCALWISWGIQPDSVIGHGWGDYSAGIAAGVFSVAEVLPTLVGRGRGLPVSGREWESIPLRAQRVTLISSAAGGRVDESQSRDVSFWASVDCGSPGWAAALAASQEGGRCVILDMAAGTVAGASVRRDGAAEILESLSLGKAHANGERLLNSLGRLWQLGRKVFWPALVEGEAPLKVSLPSYPFERKSFWLEETNNGERRNDRGIAEPIANGHAERGTAVFMGAPRPLVGEENRNGQAGLVAASSNGDKPSYKMRLSDEVFYFRDHVIAGKMIVPGAVILELARAAGAMASPWNRVTRLREVVWIRPISEVKDGPELHVHLTPSEHGAGYEVRSTEAGIEQVHARGKLEYGTLSLPVEVLPIDEIRRRCPSVSQGRETYELVREFGKMEYGPSMRCVETLCYNETEVLARLRAPDEAWTDMGAYQLNPSLMDGFFQTMMVLVKDRAVANRTPYLPYAVRELFISGPLPRECIVHTVQVDTDLSEGAKQTRTFQIKVADLQGSVIAEFKDYSVKFFPQDRLSLAVEAPRKEKAAARSGGLDPVGSLDKPTPLPMGKPSPTRREICARLQKEVAGLLGVAADSLDPGRDMGEYGMDSVLVIDFISAVNESFGMSLSPAIFFEHRSLDEFTDFLVSQTPATVPPGAADAQSVGNGVISGIGQGSEGATENGAKPAASGGEPEDADAIAVVGMSGVFPQSPDLATFWGHLVAGRNLITEIPAERWDWREFFGDPQKDGNKTNIKWGGFISDVDKFDPRFFNLSPRDAEFMDPQQRIFLETVWKTIEDAGYAPSQLFGTRTGLFVGVSSVDYQEIVMKNMGVVDVRMGAGLPLDMLPNRISFLLNLQGPSEPVSTACSSSLVALHRAIEAIRRGDCEQAIVGGVNLLLTPTPYIYFNKAGILSLDGKCKTFDHRANGYVRGEGAGAVFIKPLSRAMADGDQIYGLIKGTAVNHGGRTRTFGAPSPQAEALVVREAFERAGVSPASVSYIEAHGTGTALGDPVEISGLNKAFAEISAARGEAPTVGSCGVGSVKTNVGHLEAAAGIVGLIKVLLAMKHRRIPASLHLEKPNPYIQIAASPFYFVDRTIEWAAVQDAQNRSLPRRAGISSFGFGGVNSHVVVEEFPVAPGSSAQRKPELLVLSARALPQLRRAARALGDWIERTSAESADPGQLSLADAAFTLQIGRDVMAERLAIVATSHAEAATAVRLWLEDKQCDSVFHGHVIPRRESDSAPSRVEAVSQRAEACFREGRLSDLAKLWISGETFSWESVRSASRCRRVSLPTYPFARERYWLEPQPGSISWPSEAAKSQLDDILQQVLTEDLSPEDAASLLEALAPGEANPAKETV